MCILVSCNFGIHSLTLYDEGKKVKMNVFEETLIKFLKNPIEAMGYELYDVTYLKGNKKGKLIVYIDKIDGISLSDCEVVSRHISVLLDVENIIRESYILEVSSPGINRTLKTKKHYMDSIGKNCTISLFDYIDNQKNINGKILNVDDNGISIETSGNIKYIEFKNIKKAKLNLI